ncbi:hypothetical protein SAMN04489708_1029 [Paracidovorax cattleyae]|uniref:Uncharacterized protein n=1 Tax=Paracidovorax cattleyae TaxID=80868 RepID=A0A1H0L0K2_9BURK|nr:hypothetical protein SAMN04489708_1029 [Paracidovorax cattleyae]
MAGVMVLEMTNQRPIRGSSRYVRDETRRIGTESVSRFHAALTS